MASSMADLVKKATKQATSDGATAPTVSIPSSSSLNANSTSGH